MIRRNTEGFGGAIGNAATFFVDLHLSEGRGDKIAFREFDGQKREISYSKLARNSSVVAAALRAAGICSEQRAAMLLLDTIEYPPFQWNTVIHSSLN